MYVIICGGRDQGLGKWGVEFLDYLHKQFKFELVITGGAQGIDTDADWWAKGRGIDRIIVPANWEKDGRGAGPRRNAFMLQIGMMLSDRAGEKLGIVAFPGGVGTANMIQQARNAKVPVQICKEKEE